MKILGSMVSTGQNFEKILSRLCAQQVVTPFWKILTLKSWLDHKVRQPRTTQNLRIFWIFVTKFDEFWSNIDFENFVKRVCHHLYGHVLINFRKFEIVRILVHKIRKVDDKPPWRNFWWISVKFFILTKIYENFKFDKINPKILNPEQKSKIWNP